MISDRGSSTLKLVFVQKNCFQYFDGLIVWSFGAPLKSVNNNSKVAEMYWINFLSPILFFFLNLLGFF